MNSAIKFLFLLMVFSFSASFAQTAEEVVANYLEKSGGEEKWRNLKATKTSAEIKSDGMLVPLSIYNTNEGEQAILIEYPDTSVTQFAYDGEVLWITNSKMEAQLANEQATENMQLSKNDFPNPFLDYKKKGYQIKLTGTEKIDGKTTHVLELVQEPVIVNGQPQESLSIYYFDAKSGFPVMLKKIAPGDTKENFSVSKMKKYKKVKGLYFPFLIDENGQELKIKKIEINPEIEDSVFAFPG